MMKITSSIVQDEFIGLESMVVKSSNPYLVGIMGTVVDETRNTFTMLQNGDKKVVAKDTSVFSFILPDETIVEVDGKTIMGRPEDRIKKRLRRLW
jgi:ribonuclease P protein subunit POP4